METKSFLMGYFYASFQLSTIDETFEQKGNYGLAQIRLQTKDFGRLLVGVNRGIAPMVGNVPYAFLNIDESAFDIVSSWGSVDIWNVIKEKHTPDCNEVRISFDDLCILIDTFGGIDINEMKN